MSLKAKVEAIIYAAEEPVTLEQIALLLKDIVLADLASARENAAIEQADSAAEALAADSHAADYATEFHPAHSYASAAAESASMPELAPESAELPCPEPGPLMLHGEPSSNLPVGAPYLPQSADVADDTDGISESLTIDHPNPPVGAPHLPQSVDVADVTMADATDAAASEARTIANPESRNEEPAPSASVRPPETTSRKRQPKKTEQEIAEDKAVRTRIREVLVQLVTDYASEDRGMEIRQVAGGFRMATKPEHHDVVRAFAKSLKPPIRLSLAALETLAVIAYKQPITGPEIADIRGVESASVLGTLLDRKLITTAGRKQVIGRPMQYKTSKDFLLRFGLNDVNELPSMEEFSQLGAIEIAPPEQQETLFEPNPPTAPQAETTGGPFQPLVGLSGEPETSAEPEASQAPQPSGEAVESDRSTAEEPPSPDSASSASAPSQESENQESENVESEGSQIPDSPPPDAAEAADSQPQSDAESGNTPEAERPIGQ
jgi:segregation and condensation protein B